MKRNITGFILAILTATTSCKKDREPYNNPEVPEKVYVTTVAGDGVRGFNDGTALSARFDSPEDVVVAPDGTIYVADLSNSRIRKITDGQVSTFAGNSTQDIVNGNGLFAMFIYPSRIAQDANGNLYTLDFADSRIRKINPAADVSTYAGEQTPGYKDGNSDTARFKEGSGGIVADVHGNLYVADTYNNRIRKISVSGDVTTIAGSGFPGFSNGIGTGAQFQYPGGIVIDKQGNLFVIDRENFMIRKITPAGEVSTFVGSGAQGDKDGVGSEAQFNGPIDMVISSKGILYITDLHRIRKITPLGIVTTIAGNAEPGYKDGNGDEAKFYYPVGMGIDVNDNIYVADLLNKRIRKISFQ